MSNLVGIPKFTSILLTWSPPQEPRGIVIGYAITYRINSSNIVRVNISAVTTITFTISSLTPQTRVSAITVAAYTRIGQGQPATLPDQITFTAPGESTMPAIQCNWFSFLGGYFTYFVERFVLFQSVLYRRSHYVCNFLRQGDEFAGGVFI